MAAHFHSVPGRLRVHVPRVKGNIASARAVEASLSKLIGAQGATANKSADTTNASAAQGVSNFRTCCSCEITTRNKRTDMEMIRMPPAHFRSGIFNSCAAKLVAAVRTMTAQPAAVMVARLRKYDGNDRITSAIMIPLSPLKMELTKKIVRLFTRNTIRTRPCVQFLWSAAEATQV